jgi:uncharacterized protein YegP (UPF0339 family)
MATTVEFYKDAADPPEWRWRVKASNGQIIGASSEGYQRETYAKNNLTALPKYCREVDIKTASDQPDPRPADATLPLEFYEDNASEWRWRITAQNGQIVHASSEGYSDKAGAKGNLEGLVAAVNTWTG